MASSYTEQLKSMSLIEPDKRWSTGEGNGKPCHYSCLENPMNSMKRQKDRALKDELPRSVGTQYARASSAKTRGFHTQLDEGPETP